MLDHVDLRLFGVRPASSAVDAVDGFVREPETLSKGSQGDDSTQRPYLPDLVCGQLGAWMIYSDTRSATRYSVVGVVLDGPKEKVLGIDTRWIVAGVENAKSSSFTLIDYDPRHTVGPRIVMANNAERPVLVTSGCRPLPASVSASDLRPESLEKLGVLGRAQDKLVGTHVGLLGAFVSGAGRSGHAALGPAILPHGGAR